jgi:hypothetical protein
MTLAICRRKVRFDHAGAEETTSETVIRKSFDELPVP